LDVAGIGGSVGGSVLLSTILASAVASSTAGQLHTAGLANEAAVHGYTTALWLAVGIFALAFLLAIVILSGRAKPRVPTVKAALARHAIGNGHHFDAACCPRPAVAAR